jgi:hypothetical protein
MRRFVFAAAVAILVAGAVAQSVQATPPINDAVIRPRIFNDCPSSILTTTNNYPMMVQIQDENLSCGGFANLHVWRLSTDGVDPAVFDNDSAFRLSADLTIDGTAEGEGGLQVAPWWSQDVDGRFNVRTTDGEIACFGGRLPFYSFTASHGITYTKGTTVRVEVVYLANGLSMADPATIEYIYEDNTGTYTSGPLAFDEGNPDEDPPYGLWGMLNDARVGGYVQVFLQAGNPDAAVTATWSNIDFENLSPVSVDNATWGSIKADYR